jgi:hypothetical protein
VTWQGSIRDQVAAEFRAAQRLRSGPVASDEEPVEAVRLAAPVVESVRARARRIVTTKGVTNGC